MPETSEKPTVLIVDDNDFMRHRIAEILETNGFEVVGDAGNGADAIARYPEVQPDLVTVDLVLPDIDGVEVIRKLIDLDGYARVIVVSAIATDAKVEEAIGAGAAEFVIKPFHDDHLVSVASDALAEAGQRKLLQAQGKWLEGEDAAAVERRAAATVLVVDDSAAMRAKLVDILQLGGFGTVEEAADGREAVDRYRALKPTVVTMDLVMPNMDGMQAIEEIMAIDPEARIVVCSAMADDARVNAATHAGAREFLIKPYQVESVVDVLSAILPR